MSLSRTAPHHIKKQPLTYGKAQEAVHITQDCGGLGRSKPLPEKEGDILVKGSVATQHKDPKSAQALQDRWAAEMMGSRNNTHVKTVTKKVLVPVEEEVTVPIVRKEAVRRMEDRVVMGNKVVPVTKYKTVEETQLEVQNKVINGRTEKRAVPVTRQRRVPYTEYENKPVQITVQVPVEAVVTRKGVRKDTHVVSKLVEVAEDHHYEMRPVYVGTGQTRMTQVAEHSKFKTEHGKPQWSDEVVGSWLGKPQSPRFRSDLPRPESAGSLRSQASCPTFRSKLGGSTPLNRTGGSLGMTRPASTGKLSLHGH